MPIITLNKDFTIIALNEYFNKFRAVNTEKNIIKNSFILISAVINYTSDTAQLPNSK